jgi:hypothetical protein
VSAARALARSWMGLDRPLDGTLGVRDPDAPCAGFDPGVPTGTDCQTDGHHLCRECARAPARDPHDETPTIAYHPDRGWYDLEDEP